MDLKLFVCVQRIPTYVCDHGI